MRAQARIDVNFSMKDPLVALRLQFQIKKKLMQRKPKLAFGEAGYRFRDNANKFFHASKAACVDLIGMMQPTFEEQLLKILSHEELLKLLTSATCVSPRCAVFSKLYMDFKDQLKSRYEAVGHAMFEHIEILTAGDGKRQYAYVNWNKTGRYELLKGTGAKKELWVSLVHVSNRATTGFAKLNPALTNDYFIEDNDDDKKAKIMSTKPEHTSEQYCWKVLNAANKKIGVHRAPRQ